MLFSYLKLTMRLLARNPLSTFINVIGLSVGFAVFFILWQYSQAELKSDQFHTDFERIVRFGLTYHFKENNGETKDGILAINDPALTRDVAQTFGEVESFTRIFEQKNLSREYIPSHGQDIFLAYTNETSERKSFVENNVVYADPNLFTFFNFPLRQGNPSFVLNEPYSVVISEHIAAKYFGSDEPVGKVLQLNNETALKVTGVFKNLPRNTHLAFNIVISTLTVSNSIDKIKITNGGPYCYLKLTPATTVKSFETKVKKFVDELYNELFKKKCNTCTSEAYLQPIREIPFNSGYWFDTAIPKSKYLLVVLSSISIIILVMA
ncbi:MAG TPA: ABC transporter permease, partial [Chryseolinea sp.]|nr:ABC transporter permease [Chryseolinea sp.]